MKYSILPEVLIEFDIEKTLIKWIKLVKYSLDPLSGRKLELQNGSSTLF